MKYVVELDGERTLVEVVADGVVIDGTHVPARLERVRGSVVARLRLGDAVHRLQLAPGGDGSAWTLAHEGHRRTLDVADERRRALRDRAAAARRSLGPAPLLAPMPGLVVRVLVAPGDVVRAGQGLVVVEAMKMENELRAAGEAVVRAVRCTPGAAVEKGAVLVELAAPGTDAAGEAAATR